MMSSPELSTLCACKTWQCEPSWLSGALKHRDSFEWNYTTMLGTLGKCWDLDKQVLFQKFMLPDCRHAEENRGGEQECQQYAMQEFHDRISTAALPSNMQSFSISRVQNAYLLLWRPLCMTALSSHAVTEIRNGGKLALAEREALALQETVMMHKYLNEKSSVLLMSLASLVWETDRNRWRLQKFLPCVGQLDMEYIPQLDRDIFRQNWFKAQGSVKDFGIKVKPDKIKYNVRRRECTDTSLLDGLEQNVTDLALSATKYLQALS